MFAWLHVLLPKRSKDDPVVTETLEAITQASATLVDNESELSNNLKHLRKERQAMNKAMDEVVALIQADRRK